MYVIIDIETTGLSRYYHKITEIAAVKVEGGMIKKEFHSLVNPETRIPSFITRLTGITDEMVKDAPTITETIPRFVRFLGDNIFVAHNAAFDYGFLSHNADSNHKMAIDNDVLCTRKLSNRLLPDLPSKRLSALCEHFNIANAQHHRAMSDVHATTQIFNNLLELLSKKGITKPEDILWFESLPRKELP